ncbi:predicted protein [Botrytis cinerea T4]|uniref:Uncharacterized protein n=1 Tax=Botryotinia fuckeliana (strain T4) TaxID=999810 RepID=G2XPU7_BOTF4|nr:predicted protein [Botrytis cinerea T4]
MLQSKIRTLQEEVAALRTQLNAKSRQEPESSPNVGQSSANKRTYDNFFGALQDQSRQKTSLTRDHQTQFRDDSSNRRGKIFNRFE